MKVLILRVMTEAFRGNGSGVDGKNCDIDGPKVSKNGNGLLLKWKLRSFTLNFKFIYKFVKLYRLWVWLILVFLGLFIDLQVTIVKTPPSVLTESI